MRHSQTYDRYNFKPIIILIFFFTFSLSIQTRAQQQVITFLDQNVLTAILEQYGEGALGVNNGAKQINANNIDFSKLYSLSDPSNQGVNGVTTLTIYSAGNGIGALNGVELLPQLTELSVYGYQGLLIPNGIINLPLKTLDLSGNSISSLPPNFANLTTLENLILSYNAFTNLPPLPPGLVHLVIDNNLLSFDDLEPHVAVFLTQLDYAEQTNPVFSLSPETIELSAGQTLNASAAGYIAGSGNRYQWFKDGVAITPVSADPSLTISAMTASNGGAYSCQVTSTLLEGLTIQSSMITVSVVPSALEASDFLWGMTSRTNGNPGGTIFRMMATTAGVINEKQFTSADGTAPQGDLMQASDGFLYGMTMTGGTNNSGTIVRIYKDGTQFEKIYDFDKAIASYPRGALIEGTDGNLYGMTERGPDYSLTGTVFRINKGSVPNYTHLYEFAFQGLPSGNLIQADDGDLYGMTQIGAVSGGNMGSIFKIKTDGSGFNVLRQLSEVTLDGHQPHGNLIQASNGSLYGMTSAGGETNGGGGTLFKIETDGRGFKKLLNLYDSPKGNLIQGADGNLYGMAQGGVGNIYGFVFKADLNGANFQTLHAFANSDGAYPAGSLTEAPNGELYGMTARGGANDKGVIFKIRPDGSNFTTLYDFDATGHGPTGSLLFARKINQSITFARIPDKQITDGDFALTASSTSGLPVTLTSSNPSVASISGNTVTMHAIGSTTITASQEGDTDFDVAKNVLRILNVTGIKQNQTITFNPLTDKVADDENFLLTAFSDSGLPVQYTSSNESVATIYGNSVTIRSAGTTTITASQPGNEVYFIAEEVTQQLSISKANQLITFNPIPDKNKRSPSFTLNAYASSHLPVTYSSSNPAVATISGNIVTIMSAGTTTISVSQSGNYSYNPAVVAKQELLVGKAAQTIYFGPIDLPPAGNGTFTLEAFSDSDLPIAYSSSDESVATVSGNMITVKGNGSTVITANQSGNTDYLPAVAATQKLTIARKDQSITFNSLPLLNVKTISYELNASASSGLGVIYTSSNQGVATVTGNKVTIVGLGSSIITASQNGNAVFNAAPEVQQELVIAKTNQAITFNAIKTKTMGEEAFSADARSNSNLDINLTSEDDEITIEGSVITILKPGFVTITAHQQGDGSYNAAEPVSQSFCVIPATPVITASFEDPHAPVLISGNASGNQWYLDGNALAGEVNTSITISQQGMYSVSSTAETCSSTMSEVMALIATGVGEKNPMTVLTIYPNPATEAIQLTLEMAAGQTPYVSIHNSNGKLMHSGGTELINQAISVSDYAPGLYLASITIGDKVIMQKFIKK